MKYITGSQGFIGSHLTKQLGEYTAIAHADIQSTKLTPFDYFYFLSSYGNLSSQVEDAKIIRANVSDLIYPLLQAKEFKFKSFVYTSSSSVKLKTRTMYSRAKTAAEEILLAVMEKYDVPICIVRPFSVTGVGEQAAHLIPTLIAAAYTGKYVNLVPNATHDFIDVEDVVAGILSLSKHSARGIFELGTGVKTSNQEVLNLVQEITGKQIKVNYIDYLRPYDNGDWVSTNYRARGYGWVPKKTLKQSITEMVEAYEDQKGATLAR